MWKTKSLTKRRMEGVDIGGAAVRQWPFPNGLLFVSAVIIPQTARAQRHNASAAAAFGFFSPVGCPQWNDGRRAGQNSSNQPLLHPRPFSLPSPCPHWHCRNGRLLEVQAGEAVIGAGLLKMGGSTQSDPAWGQQAAAFGAANVFSNGPLPGRSQWPLGMERVFYCQMWGGGRFCCCVGRNWQAHREKLPVVLIHSLAGQIACMQKWP